MAVLPLIKVHHLQTILSSSHLILLRYQNIKIGFSRNWLRVKKDFNGKIVPFRKKAFTRILEFLNIIIRTELGIITNLAITKPAQ